MAIQMSTKTYLELINIPTFEERFEYLQLRGAVGKETFGYDRYLNQVLYNSQKWKLFRDHVIVRDNGCDLACEDHLILDVRDKDGKIHRPKIIVHHINPISVDDVINLNPMVFDMNNVITTTMTTHNAIHYGDESLLIKSPIERSRNDTCPWRH